jgi:hypothetical protein
MLIAAFGAMAYYTWTKNQELVGRTRELKELSQYNMTDFSNAMSNEGIDMPSTIQEMVDLYDKSVQDKQRIE